MSILSGNRKEEIIMATLELASQIGLGAVSMNMIAKKVGIKKPSLYNHFESKDLIIESMYDYLRKCAEQNANINNNWCDIPNNISANDILKNAVRNYLKIIKNKNMLMFYKVIYTERTISKEASKIMLNETHKMIFATKKLLEIMQAKQLLYFDDIEISAIAFALTIHAFIDYEMDKNFVDNDDCEPDCNLIDRYIDNFCNQNKVEK